MKPLRQDLSVFSKLQLEKPPVGVKFLFFKPKSLKQLDMNKNLSFCEMLDECWAMNRFISAGTTMKRVSANSC